MQLLADAGWNDPEFSMRVVSFALNREILAAWKSE
jgi:hypothetical protein